MKFNNLNIKSFFGRLMLSHLIIIFISLTVIGVMFGYLVQNYYFGLKEWEATNNGRRIAELVSENISGGNIRSNKLNKDSDKIKTISRSSNMDIGLMNAQGKMIFNVPTIKSTSLTLEKPEIDHVLKGNTITKKIMGPKYKNLLMVFPLLEKNNDIVIMGPKPTSNQPNVVGAVIIQTPLGSITATINNIIRLILYSFLVAIIAALFLSISFTKRFTQPLEAIQNSALKSAEGEFQEVTVPENSSTEIKHLVNTFNYAVTQINETLEKKRILEKMRKEFVANVSHEFRAPLTSIKGFLEIINDQNLSQSDVQECIDIMYKDTEYLEHLLSDLSTLGQLESRNISLNKELVSPDQLINRAIKTMKNRLEEKQINLEVKLEENLPELYVDLNRIHQVLINLLENAVTYSPEGGQITIKVKSLSSLKDLEIDHDKEISETKSKNQLETRLVKETESETESEAKTNPKKHQEDNEDLEDNKIQFSIIDQGPGIPAEDIDNIWQRFYKVDRARTREQKKGSGLGLSIVKDIVLKHGGTVKVDSSPNSGSTFSFII